jgi:two-component system, NarL family, nitrate/nitrite response regulator NarL
MANLLVVERSEAMALGIASCARTAACEITDFCRTEDELLSIMDDVQPDLIIFGRGLPSSSALVSKLSEAAPIIRGIAIRESIEAPEVFSLAAQGVIGILHQDAGISKYRACIASVLQNCQWIDPEFFPTLLHSPEKQASDLTSREVQIIHMVQQGCRNKQIAYGLGISEGTVKMHLHHIFAKLRLQTRTELALRAKQSS